MFFYNFVNSKIHILIVTNLQAFYIVILQVYKIVPIYNIQRSSVTQSTDIFTDVKKKLRNYTILLTIFNYSITNKTIGFFLKTQLSTVSRLKVVLSFLFRR